MGLRTYFNYVHPIISTPKNIWNTSLDEIKLTCTLESVRHRKDRKLATQVPERWISKEKGRTLCHNEWMDEWRMGARQTIILILRPQRQLTECPLGIAGQPPDVWNTHPRHGTMATDHVGDGVDTSGLMAHECKGTGRGERCSEGTMISAAVRGPSYNPALPLTSYLAMRKLFNPLDFTSFSYQNKTQ